MWEPSERVTTESSKNTRMIRRGFLLFLASMSASLGLECQDSRLGNCHCQNLSLRANLELFCPSFQPHKQKLHTLIEKFEKPEKDVELTCSNGVAWLDKWVSVMTAQQLVSEIFYSSKASRKLFVGHSRGLRKPGFLVHWFCRPLSRHRKPGFDVCYLDKTDVFCWDRTDVCCGDRTDIKSWDKTNVK